MLAAVTPQTASRADAREEERKKNRPYRRFVRVVFFVAAAVMAGLILRGIIRSLDRMPSPTGARPSGPLDVRALRACAEDLGKLEQRLRTAAGELLSRNPSETTESWQTFVQPIELERMSIVARCNLDEPTNDPAVEDLKIAAGALEDLARSYALLYERHKEEGLKRARDAQNALDRAHRTLKARK